MSLNSVILVLKIDNYLLDTQLFTFLTRSHSLEWSTIVARLRYISISLFTCLQHIGN
jgi:hypothetical protein